MRVVHVGISIGIPNSNKAYIGDLRRIDAMSISERIEALKQKHHDLEQKIENEESRPHPDEITVHDLKKQKLQIKDELLSMGAA